MTNHPFPLEIDALMTTIVHLLGGRGEQKAVGLLAEVQPEVVDSQHESYNEWLWDLVLYVHPKVYVQIDEDERRETEQLIGATASEVMRACPGDDIASVRITPLRIQTDWRTDAKAFASGKGVNNQGRVRSDNVAGRQFDGLLFRSQAEIRLYDALKRTGVPFAPLPVFVRGGESRRRMEPDFVVIRDKTVMVVEVDGDSVHHETPVEAHNRTKMLQDEGVHIERIPASECDTDDRARACVGRVLASLEKHAGRVR